MLLSGSASSAAPSSSPPLQRAPWLRGTALPRAAAPPPRVRRCVMPNTDTAATRSRTKGALLGGLRSGALEKAVEKMEDDLAEEEAGSADLEARLRALFASIDVDGNGVLSREELSTKLRQDTEIQTLVDSAGKSSMYLFEQLDADSDGSITVEEFLKLCVPYPDDEDEEEEEEEEEEAEEDPLLEKSRSVAFSEETQVSR